MNTKLAPDVERVSRDTAIRLGWYFCIKCGKQFPDHETRYKRKQSHNTLTKPRKPRHRRTKTKTDSSVERPLQDEPWIDSNGELWIVSLDGSAKKEGEKQ